MGSGSKVTEVCPEHPGSRVVRCGTYGRAGERRQRFLCEPADGSAKHRFAGPAPRLVAAAGICFACGNPVAPHEGPRAPGRYRFPVVEAAEALVMVGQGVSYTEAANRVRQRLDRAIAPAVAKVWPEAFHKLCEHHLREGARRQLEPYGLTSFGHRSMELLNDAFRTRDGWEAFKSDHGGGVKLQAWVEANDAVITEQVTSRDGLPQHHSTGALDECLAKVREFVEPRAFCYRNAERTNRMLDLVRLRLNKADDPRHYAAAIRTWLEKNRRLPEQGTIRDARGNYSLR